MLRTTLLVLVLVGCKSKSNEQPKPEPAKVADPPKTDPPKKDEPPKGEPLPDLADNAPKDKPKVGFTPEQEAKIAELSVDAKKTYPAAKARYAKGLPKGEAFFVTTALTSPGAKETVFIAVNKIDGTKITGTIASNIMSVKGYKAGDGYTFQESDIVDWLITKPDGSEEGNNVGKYIDTLH